MSKSANRKRRKRSFWRRITPIGKILILVSMAVLIGCIIAVTVSTIKLNKSKQPETVYIQPTTQATTHEPTKGYVGNKNIVVIDPGHGGNDPGSVAGNILEKENCLTISLLVRDRLEAAGVTVIMTRDSDITLSKERRAEIANATDACLFVSIHRNNYAADPTARGIEAWIEKSGLEADYAVSYAILNKLNSLFLNINRGVLLGSTGDNTVNYYVNGHTKMTSTLIELGFLSNAEDNAVVIGNSTGCAKAIADGILEFLSTLD